MPSDASFFGTELNGLRRLLMLGNESSEQDESGVPAETDEPMADHIGRHIGRFELLRVLGEGGMGIVYLAGQSEPIRRQVALKLIKPGMDSKQVINRFEAERQVLAQLAHANIAQVLDGGTTTAGRPYFVMEYIDGQPITAYCDQHTLPIPSRLTLFQQICQAVHHAHQRGIIHRDIKPSNILVTERDGQPIPKIIDFGVAKAIAQPLTERTFCTEQGQWFGTPEYMSPEQADLALEEVDTRSDVYALGVLLYELLVGANPYASDDLRSGGISHICHVIRETEPRTPSSRLKKLGDTAAIIAENRRTQTRDLERCLQRELEWIPLKAMRKERAERYQSVADLAEDIENYLKGDALNAGPPGTVYRLRKLVRRHTRIAVLLVVVLVTLITGIVVSTRFAFKAERSLAEAQSIADFLQKDVFGNVSYEKARDSDFAYIVDVATERLNEGRFKDQPLIEASIRYTLAQTYNNILKPEQALKHLERAHQIYLERLGPEDGHTIQSNTNMGWALRHLGRIKDAERLWTKQLETLEKSKVSLEALERSSVQEQNVTGVLNGLANTHQVQGHYKSAESLFRRILEINERMRGNRHYGLWHSLNLAATLTSMGQYEEAETLFLEVLDLARQEWGPEDGWTLSYTAKLGHLYHRQGRISEAKAVLANTLEVQRRVLVADHPQTLRTMRFLALIRIEEGNIEEAEKLLVNATKGKHIQNEFGEAYQELETKNTLAVLRIEQGQYSEARRLLQEALEIYRRDLGDDNPYTLKVICDLGVMRREQGQFEEAQKLLTQAFDGRHEILGSDHPACFESMHELALLYIAQKDYEKAAPLLLDAFNGCETKLGPNHPRTVESLIQLVNLYESWNEPGEAEKWQVKLQQNRKELE